MTGTSVAWTRRSAVAVLAAGLTVAAMSANVADAASAPSRYAGEYRFSRTFSYIVDRHAFIGPTSFPYTVDFALRVGDDGSVEGTGSGLLSYDYKGEHHETTISAAIGGKIRRRGPMGVGTLVAAIGSGPGFEPPILYSVRDHVRAVRTAAGELVLVNDYADIVGICAPEVPVDPAPAPAARTDHPHAGEYTFTSRFEYHERSADDPHAFTVVPLDVAWRAFVLPDGTLVGTGSGVLPGGTVIATELGGDVRRSRRADGVVVQSQYLREQTPRGPVYLYDFRDHVRAERSGDLTLLRRGDDGTVEEQAWTLVGPLR